MKTYEIKNRLKYDPAYPWAVLDDEATIVAKFITLDMAQAFVAGLAAPDLLAALEAIVARIDGVWDHPALLAYGPLDMTEGDCKAIARAAIAKATQP